jgi:hypothetical protein
MRSMTDEGLEAGRHASSRNVAPSFAALACSVWRESAKIWADAREVATSRASDGRDRTALGLEPRMSLVRPSFALVLNR